jgi:hypothetical protein
MKKIVFTVCALAFATVATPAFAFHCPKDMKAIDAALAKHPKLTPEQMAKVAELRTKGEAQLKAGQHKQSVDSLAEAMKMLRIK